MKIEFFQSCGHCWVVQICWHIECSTLTASAYGIWNSLAGVPSLPLALFLSNASWGPLDFMFQAHLTSHSMMSGSRWLTTLSWLSGSLRSFLYSFVYSCHLFLISSASVQFSSVAQSCPTLCDPMNRSTPGLPVYHRLPASTQTYVHCVGDAIQPSHPLSSPSPPALNLSQHQGIFKWVSSSHQVAKVLEFQLQHQSLQWTPRTYLL